ncbi:hypothetical protein M2163_000796 [Streptomyces sp. SAI-135]|uniref:hypothetical protein n=1 Tax=Streptomyces sp. SAI-124 TaxID=3377730 RepID=UPI00247DA84A|nr:hypothetical protein [Streptomyces sp. SAI-090]MDH6554317.1 hypothetical protein [Streptomyces sp. SAI-041]MDH6581683.1 hypothetical protein [Streptomyces sp. SAI-133]MDH6613688.1 hypothetical protein [Streptomyces sp. SAI-135]
MIPSLVRSLVAVHERRRALETQVGQLLEAHPLQAVLTLMPEVAVRSTSVLPLSVGEVAPDVSLLNAAMDRTLAAVMAA